MDKIVVIDDQFGIRALIQDALEDSGFEVFTADNGEIGLSLVAEHSPKIVITDIFMPVKEGVNVVRSIKQDYPHIKVIVISGADRRENYFETAKQFGADETLSKPFKMECLIDLVLKLL